MFEPFQKFMTRASNRYGITREMQAAKVCHDFRVLVPEIFKGKEGVEDNITPASFKEKILTINVENSAWGQEVIMRKEKIITQMNEKAGKEIVQDLRTQLKK